MSAKIIIIIKRTICKIKVKSQRGVDPREKWLTQNRPVLERMCPRFLFSSLSV